MKTAALVLATWMLLGACQYFRIEPTLDPGGNLVTVVVTLDGIVGCTRLGTLENTTGVETLDSIVGGARPGTLNNTTGFINTGARGRNACGRSVFGAASPFRCPSAPTSSRYSSSTPTNPWRPTTP